MLFLVVAGTPPATVRVGCLSPSFKTAAAGYGMDDSGIKRFSSFYLAIKEINNKTDGVWDDLLPNTTLEYAWVDSKRDDTAALFGSLELATDAFGGEGVVGVIGAASSGPSTTAALCLKVTETPQISYSATSPLLSDGMTYSYFLRTSPSDALEGFATADIMANLWGFTAVAVVHSTDTYGEYGAQAFLDAAQVTFSISILTTQPINNDQRDFSSQYRALLAVDARIIFLCTQAKDGGPFLRGAYELGLGGEGFLWFGGNGPTSYDLFRNDDSDVTIDADGTVSEGATRGMGTNLVVREAVMRGYFGISPAVGRGTDVYSAYVARLAMLGDTAGNGAPTMGNPNGCNLETDDDGRYIWAQDHDNDPSTDLACAGNDNLEDDNWAPFSYDATFALAHAIHTLLYVENRTSVVGSELLDTLIQNVSFAGVTGLVDFHDGSAHPDRTFHGDRRVGIGYDVFNYGGGTQTQGDTPLEQVGKYTPCQDNACAFSARWEQSMTLCTSDCAIRYSTADNAVPVDVPPPECGHEHYEYTVGECDAASLTRRLAFAWAQPQTCVAMPFYAVLCPRLCRAMPCYAVLQGASVASRCLATPTSAASTCPSTARPQRRCSRWRRSVGSSA